MRIVNGVLGLLLLLFAAVQVNDPDGPFWIAAYGVGAFWPLLAALAPAALARLPAILLLAATLVIALAGVARFWPTAPGWWRTEVWWATETAREGMGMMIVAAALLAPLATALAARRGNRRRA